MRASVDTALGFHGRDVVERAAALAAEAHRDPQLREAGELLNELSRMLEASRRQFLRLGFDLHDGPLQDVAGLRTDLHLFRKQLAGSLEGHPHAATLVGRVDDLVARLLALDGDLRSVATDVEASQVAERELSDAVRETVESFAGACTVRLELDPELDAAETTPSQRIAVVRIIQGALANVVRHSGADAAVVTVRRTDGGVEAEVVDHGCGFDVSAAFRSAHAEGRIGLSAMRERVRLLGGKLTVDSRRDGPTRVAVFFPVWRGHGRV